ncbi:MAG: helix-hairpin-helix domain-containing protein [Oscillospiraceae bacterium]|nr:helix-hairpin-helix domain-containing protein [Oscillospiraceae bacterium]
MRLRRLEFVVIAVTLAFACFMGGFFAGRNWSAVNIVAVSAQSGDLSEDGSINVVRQLEVTIEENHGNFANSSSAANNNAKNDSLTNNTDETPQSITKPAQSEESIGVPRGGDGKINVNLASQSELTDLPGIGNVLASRIIDYRRQHGDFARVEDLRNVSGIGEKRYEAIQDVVTVG